MNVAKISTSYAIAIIPTEMRYTMQRGMYVQDGEKVCDIRYDIVSTKYLKDVENEDGSITSVATDFVTPVQFDSGMKTIPYGLYLLIESYRLDNSPEKLAQINMALTQFEFQGSLSEFVLQVEDVE